MKKLLVIAFVVFGAFAALGGWRIGAAEFENMQFQDALRDLASQAGVNATYKSPHSDEEFEAAVLNKAKDCGINLTPEQVTVKRSGSGVSTTMYLAADYNVVVDVPGRTFILHFTPASEKQP